VIAYEVRINGRKVATAGIEQGVVSCIANWVSLRKGSRRAKAQRDAGFRVGGLRNSPSGDEFLDWARRRLKIGDEITLRLVDVASADRPKTIRRKSKRKT
jgi:hypothetical protein